ncbi:ATP-binding cassette domain-containing protein [Curtobacterium sp. RRHDQ10]|uniref:ATP-binding cassette domain-containing protein n=1 Tax=Curtobacterium phyllosphaerae TaxID=3413379 RepID=UPI003BF3019F
MTGGLTLDDVRVTVGPRVLLEHASRVVPAGTALAVTGPAGSGTSSVLRAIAGRVAGSGPAGSGAAGSGAGGRGAGSGAGGRASVGLEGRVAIDGQPIDPQAVGLVTQQHDLLGGLSAAENVAVRALGRPGAVFGADDWAATEQLLARLGLPETSWHNLVEQLSGGQQQRVAIARALIGAPELICLDDPTSELDAATRDVVWDALVTAMDGGAVVVLAAPDPALAERCGQTLSIG